MLDAIKHMTDDNCFLSGRQYTVHYACNRVQLNEKYVFLCVSLFCQVVQKHKLPEVAYHSKASFDCQRWDVFETRCIVLAVRGLCR